MKKANVHISFFYMPDFDKPGKSSSRPKAKLFDNCFWCLGGDNNLFGIFSQSFNDYSFKAFFRFKKARAKRTASACAERATSKNIQFTVNSLQGSDRIVKILPKCGQYYIIFGTFFSQFFSPHKAELKSNLCNFNN